MYTEKLAIAAQANWDRLAGEQPPLHAGTLLVGLGSHQGNDCVGWCVACAVAAALQKIAAAECRRVSVRLARQPLELLHWCSGRARLVIVDACLPELHGEAHFLPSPGAWERWRWPDVPALRLRPVTSHDFGLQQTLALASELAMLPAEVEVWGLYVAPHSVHTVPGLSGHAQPHAADALAATRSTPSGVCLGGWTRSEDFGAVATVRPTRSDPSPSGAEVCGRCADLVCQLSPLVRAALPKIVDELVRSLAGPALVEEAKEGPKA